MIKHFFIILKYIYVSKLVYDTGTHFPFILNSISSTIQAQRSMFTYVTTTHSQDPLYTTNSQTNLINFCISKKINIIYLDMYNYLGSSNYTTTHQTTVQNFISQASANNIGVWAYGGDTDWTESSTQSFIQTAIIANINKYNAASAANQKFKGFILDVEFWTDNSQTTMSGLTGLISLIQTMKSGLNLPVACYVPFFFMNDDTDYPMLTINGNTKYPGAFIMDTADSVTVACYRNTAADNNTNKQNGQITLFQPWYNYGIANGIKNLYLTSETTNISPSYTTYYNKGTTYMEAQYALDLLAFPNRNVCAGISVDSYDGWRVMGS